MAASVLSLLHFYIVAIFRCVAVSGARKQVYACCLKVKSAGDRIRGLQGAVGWSANLADADSLIRPGAAPLLDAVKDHKTRYAVRSVLDQSLAAAPNLRRRARPRRPPVNAPAMDVKKG
jgi:hypothetical protein